MADTLLAIVQKASGRLSGLSVPASVVGNPDAIVADMLALAIEEGDELMRAHDWSALVVEGATISLIAGQETYPLPADFDRLVGQTTWDRAVRWRLQGPDSAAMARARRESLYPADALRRAFRQVGNAITIWPVPATTGDVIAFDYVSSNWAASAVGARQATFLADTDVPVIPSHLFVFGLKWRWLDAQNFASDRAQSLYGDERRKAISRDMGGGRVVNMGRKACDELDGFPCDGVMAGPVVTLPTISGS